MNYDDCEEAGGKLEGYSSPNSRPSDTRSLSIRFSHKGKWPWKSLGTPVSMHRKGKGALTGSFYNFQNTMDFLLGYTTLRPLRSISEKVTSTNRSSFYVTNCLMVDYPLEEQSMLLPSDLIQQRMRMFSGREEIFVF